MWKSGRNMNKNKNAGAKQTPSPEYKMLEDTCYTLDSVVNYYTKHKKSIADTEQKALHDSLVNFITVLVNPIRSQAKQLASDDKVWVLLRAVSSLTLGIGISTLKEVCTNCNTKELPVLPEGESIPEEAVPLIEDIAEQVLEGQLSDKANLKKRLCSIQSIRFWSVVFCFDLNKDTDVQSKHVRADRIMKEVLETLTDSSLFDDDNTSSMFELLVISCSKELVNSFYEEHFKGKLGMVMKNKRGRKFVSLLLLHWDSAGYPEFLHEILKEFPETRPLGLLIPLAYYAIHNEEVRDKVVEVVLNCFSLRDWEYDLNAHKPPSIHLAYLHNYKHTDVFSRPPPPQGILLLSYMMKISSELHDEVHSLSVDLLNLLKRAPNFELLGLEVPKFDKTRLQKMESEAAAEDNSINEEEKSDVPNGAEEVIEESSVEKGSAAEDKPATVPCVEEEEQTDSPNVKRLKVDTS